MRRLAACVSLACACACGCGRPFFARDGTLVIPEKGARGASVVTENGLEFHDVADVPQRIVVRDPYEPWRAPVGFLVPTSGRFTRTSEPTRIETAGLAVSLRPSDSRVPSWGGEMLVRIDVQAPAAPGAARPGQDVVVVLDGRGPDTGALVTAALNQLGAHDRIVVVDTAGNRVVVPPMPASNRQLIAAAVERRLSSRPGARVGVARAAAAALGALSAPAAPRVVALTDAPQGDRGTASSAELAAEIGDVAAGVSPETISVVGTTAQGEEARAARVRRVQALLPPAGDPAFGDVVIAFEGTPAPSHVLEASGGDARWELEGGELAIGEVRGGDLRTEVVRVTIPAWTPGQPFTLHVSVRFDDLSRGGEPRAADADLSCVYDDDIERLAESRHGDVIAYASALATVARLDAAFLVGSLRTAAELRSVAQMHARSLALLARDMHDPAAAALLEALRSLDAP